MGCYLLGATAPDVRIITERPRIETHFFDLGTGNMGDGVAGLFAAYPELRSPVSNVQAAFVAGYLTHLVADEIWIVSMYRRYFDGPHIGGSGGFGSRDATQLYDRAAQLVLDRAGERRVRSLLNSLDEVGDEIEGLAAGPLDAEVVRNWRVWTLDFLGGQRPYSWGRLRHMADRISDRDPDHPSHEIAERFLSDIPAGLKTLHAGVPKSELDDYMERAVDNLARVVGEYLAVGSVGAVRVSSPMLHDASGRVGDDDRGMAR
jgi:hypothetical protein